MYTWLIHVDVWQKPTQCCCCVVCSVMSDSANPWAVTHQTPLPMEFSRQEYWNGLPFPHPGDRPDPGIKPTSLASPALADRFFTTAPHGKPNQYNTVKQLSSNQK